MKKWTNRLLGAVALGAASVANAPSIDFKIEPVTSIAQNDINFAAGSYTLSAAEASQAGLDAIDTSKLENGFSFVVGDRKMTLEFTWTGQAWAQRVGPDAEPDQPAPSCENTGTCGGGDTTNNNKAVANNAIRQNFTALGLHAAAASVGDGCTAVTGVNVGAGWGGFVAGISFSNVDREFFVACRNRADLEVLVNSSNCRLQELGANAMATTNPFVAAAARELYGRETGFTIGCQSRGVSVRLVK